MLIARSKSSYEWRAVMQAISTIVDEAVFNATSGGISFRAMDPSHVALIDIQWSNAAFEQYSCDSEIIFAVRVDELLKMLKRADKDESLEVRMGMDEKQESMPVDLLALSFTKYNAKRSREYKLRLLEVGSTQSTPLPKLSFATKVNMSLKALIDALKDVEVVSEQVTITCSSNAIRFEGKGDAGKASVTFEQDEEVREINTNTESRSTYSIEYLMDIVNAVDDAESVVLEYSSKMPLRLEFVMPFMCRIHYYLAPRVE